MIAGATMTLTLSGVDLLSAFGPAMAISVLVAALVSLTFLPACLALFGRFVFWPHRLEVAAADQPPEAESPRGRGRFVGTAANHPILVVVFCLALAPRRGERAAPHGARQPDRPRAADDDPVEQRYDEATQDLGPAGRAVDAVIEREGAGSDAGALTSLQERIEAQPGRVGARPATGSLSYHRASSSPKTGGSARFLVVLEADPDGPVAPDILSGLEAQPPTMLEKSGLDGRPSASPATPRSTTN